MNAWQGEDHFSSSGRAIGVFEVSGSLHYALGSTVVDDVLLSVFLADVARRQQARNRLTRFNSWPFRTGREPVPRSLTDVEPLNLSLDSGLQAMAPKLESKETGPRKPSPARCIALLVQQPEDEAMVAWPHWRDHMASLEVLSVACGEQAISHLEFLGQCTSLRQLRITGPAGDIIDQVTHLTTLNHLSLTNCHSVSVEGISCLVGLRQLSLGCNLLSGLPDDIGCLTQLTEMDLSWSYVTDLPSSLQRVSTLERLVLVGNDMGRVPDVLREMPFLKVLDISSNHLSCLPEFISCLTTLEELNLSSNRLEELPDSLGGCARLQELALCNNMLRTLPDTLSLLTALKVLAARKNRLVSLPDLSALTSLNYLIVSGNQLTTLPAGLDQLVDLQVVEVGDNRLHSPPFGLLVHPTLLRLSCSAACLSC